MRENLIGQKFGLLTVIDFAPDEISPKGYHIPRWTCRCECGNIVVTRGSSLKSGHTKGCGQKHRAFEDLSGQKFGKLTAIKRVENKILPGGGQYVRWLCKCDCGKETLSRATSLKNGTARSCGCSRSESTMGIGLTDLTGRRFGRWTVLYESGRAREPRGRIVPLWHCRCDCGTEKDIRAGSLVGGTSLSCGCYKYDVLKEKASQGFGISKLESITKDVLDDFGLNYEVQVIFPDLKSDSGYPLSYDFVVHGEDIDTIIECQGKQHYEPIEYFGGEDQFEVQKENDAIKGRYARDNGYRLVYIPYTKCSYDEIKDILSCYFL